MARVRHLAVMVMVLLASACSEAQFPKTLPDTPANRQTMAKKYLEAMPPTWSRFP